jgi:peptidoglycan/LPS O-acetylase OafA/YrhL
VEFDRVAQQWALHAGLLDARYRGLTDSSVRPLYLWFLEYALLFSLACWPLRAGSRAEPFERLTRAGAPEWLLLLSALTAGAQLWFGEPTPAFSFVPQPASLAHFGPFFVVGWLLWGTRLDAFRRCWWLGPAGLMLSCVVYSRPLQWQPLGVCLGSLSTWAVVLGALSLAVRLTTPPTPRVRWLVESAYWVYLVHYPVVVSWHLLLAQTPWPAWPKFLLVIALALAVSLGSDALLIRRSFIGRWLTPSRARTPRAEG